MFLGIEIGGTKLQLGLGLGDGILVGLHRETIVPAEGGDGIRRRIVAAVPQLLADAGITASQLQAIGVGFGGPVDDRGRIITSHQIAGWDRFPLADWLSETFKLPAKVGNDADVAGLAEAKFGAGQGANPVFYITIGSGIGGGLILDGKIHRGTGRGAAEIGHLRVPVPGSPDADWVPVERIASGWAIEQATLRALDDENGNDELWRRLRGDSPRLTTQIIAAAARLGDPIARTVFARAHRALAEAICDVIALICPQRIVLGGGVSLLDEDLWLSPIRVLVANRVFRPFADCCEIVTAQLGESVVVHGALALAHC